MHVGRILKGACGGGQYPPLTEIYFDFKLVCTAFLFYFPQFYLQTKSFIGRN